MRGHTSFRRAKPLMVEVQDVLDARLRRGHIGPVRVPGDGDEIELLTRVRQGVLERAVPVGDAAMVVQIAVEQLIG